MHSLPTKILPRNVLDAVKRNRPVYAIGRRVRFALGSRLGARPVSGLSGRVHYNDFMLTSPDPALVKSYRDGAVSVVRMLEETLAGVGRDASSIGAVLEVGCGYGRIVRELRDRISASKIHVTDVIDEGASFTAAEFGVTKIPVVEQAGPEWRDRFDLIYLLSVYTHLRIDLIEDNLRAAADMLAPGGVLVFTTHGQGSADTAERYEQYWLDKSRVLAGMAEDGYYYERYPYYYAEYGLTWMTRPAVERLVAKVAPSLQPASWRAMGAEGHQDIHVWRKPQASGVGSSRI